MASSMPPDQPREGAARVRQKHFELRKRVEHAAVDQAHGGVAGFLRIAEHVDHEEILHALGARSDTDS